MENRNKDLAGRTIRGFALVLFFTAFFMIVFLGSRVPGPGGQGLGRGAGIKTSATPTLSEPTVWPLTGNNFTDYTFQVKYTDIDNDAPTNISVLVNGTPHAMTKLMGTDDDYTDGVYYIYTTNLAAGYWNATFFAEDAPGSNATTVPIIFFVENFTNANAPTLSSVNVSPKIGNQGTVFNFSVLYFDADGDLPVGGANVTINSSVSSLGTFALTQSDAGDTDVTDGKSYYYLTTLPVETYTFQFSFDDGLHRVTSPWVSWPRCEPFYNVNPVSLVSPTNGSVVASGIVFFDWTSSAAPGVDYHWQLSGSPSFSPVLLETSNIGSSSYIATVNLAAGTYYWRVRAEFNTIADDWSDPFVLHVTSNNNFPVLTGGSVTPNLGTTDDLYSFYVTYTDADNNPPAYVRVYINGTMYSMSKVYPGDTDYTDGCLYGYSRNLAAGTYQYYFQASDGANSQTTATYTNLNVLDPNDYAPFLQGPDLMPGSGHNSTPFTFSIWYYDLDNDLPAPGNISVVIDGIGSFYNSTTFSMTAADAGDVDATDGKLYEATITLPSFGAYRYMFNCSDGYFNASTPWYDGPVLNYFAPEGSYLANYTWDYHPFNWFDIDGATDLALADDEERQLDLPFAFPFYDKYYDTIWVSANGFVSFALETATSGSFPDNNPIISLLWRDLNPPSSPGSVYFENLGSAVVVSWVDIVYFPTNPIAGSFQVVIMENGTILINYDYVSNLPSGYTVGVNYGTNMSYYTLFTALNTSVDDVSLIFSNLGTNHVWAPALLAPASGATITNGTNATFSWWSIMPPYGSLNYTWQLSNSPSFSTILNTTTSIPESSITTEIQYLVDLPPGTYYWRVRPEFNGETGSWSETFTFTVPSPPQQNPPVLSEAMVDPATGDNATTFTFYISYSDADNDAPVSINVNLNGTLHAMTKLFPADDDYTDGCMYFYSSTLPNGTIPYNFTASDGNATVNTTNYTLVVGVATPPGNLNAPILSNAIVSPPVGSLSRIYTYSVIFTDADGDLPVEINVTIIDTEASNNNYTFNMIEADAGDTDTTDGKLYVYQNGSMSWGTHRFIIQARDANYSVQTPSLNGPQVKPFYDLRDVFYEDFESGSLAPNWTFTGSAGVSTATSNSGVMSAYHRWNAGAITSIVIPLDPGLPYNISYWIRQGGNFAGSLSENPDRDEDLVVEYYGNDLAWHQLSHHDPLQPPGTIDIINMELPANALHSGFQVRFRQLGGSGSNFDYWHIDDVYIFTKGSKAPILVSPADGFETPQANVTFEWNTMGIPNTTFEWQLSGSQDFSNILLQNSSINDTGGVVSLVVNLNLSRGTYYWRVRTHVGPYVSDWSEVREIVVFWPTQAPVLSNPTIWPATGDSTTAFTFIVTYTQAENRAPDFINVTINATGTFAMTKVNPNDDDYTDGCLYQYTRVLGAGIWWYQFNASLDSLNASSANFTTANLTAPPPAPNSPPTITNIEVTPVLGDDTEIFTFSFLLQDDDGDVPAVGNATITIFLPDGSNTTVNMAMAGGGGTAGDGDTSNTELYVYNYNPPAVYGTYLFYINVSDGVNPPVVTGNKTGPTITPFGTRDGPTLLTLANNSVVDRNNSYTFSWNALDSSLGTSNYTLQVSADPAFGTLEFDVDNVNTTSHDLNLSSTSPGKYYWRVRPTFNDTYIGPWSDVFVFSIFSNESTPSLSGHQVSPESGDSSVLFVFSVTYTDADNNAPLQVLLWLNGSSFKMVKNDTADDVYTDGCVYVYELHLAPGTYSYRVTARDITGSAQTSSKSLVVTERPPVQDLPQQSAPPAPFDYMPWLIGIGVAVAAGLAVVFLATSGKKISLGGIGSRLGRRRRGGPGTSTSGSGGGSAADVKTKVLRCPHCNSQWPMTDAQYQLYVGKENTCTNCGKKFTPS